MPSIQTSIQYHRTLRTKLDVNSGSLSVAKDPRFIIPLPPSVDLNNVVHMSARCTASHRNGVESIHEPMVRFRSHERTSKGKTRYRQIVIFNDEAHQQYKLKHGQFYEMYADREINPTVVLFRHVEYFRFGAPAHTHRLGKFQMVKESGEPETSRVSGRPTAFRGVLGYPSYRHLKLPLYNLLPDLNGKCARLYQIGDNPNLLAFLVNEIKPIPQDQDKKMFRVGRMCRSHDYEPPVRSMPMPLAFSRVLAILRRRDDEVSS